MWRKQIFRISPATRKHLELINIDETKQINAATGVISNNSIRMLHKALFIVLFAEKLCSAPTSKYNLLPNFII